MAESVVSSVGQTIGKLLVDEAKFLRGVEDKVEDLQRELRLIQCLLRDADARGKHNEAVGECVAQLRDLAYDAEDLIERYILRATLKEGQNIIKAYACFDDELFEKLQKTLKEKSCIVVLDDIWTKDAWDSLRVAFRVENTKSKLLITTRNRDVAKYINPQGIHELQCLSDRESWDLLKKRAFPKTKGLVVEISSHGPGVGQDTVASQAIEDIAKQLETDGQKPEITEDMKKLAYELLKKCAGLPLAIIVLGGLLAVNEWKTIHEKINLHFSDKSDVSKVLALSYDDLPWHLKPCFLYLGSFPEDTEILATKVLYMWIAEGFVSLNAYEKERGISVEDVAKQYLTELVNRGMVQARFKLSGMIKSYHLHDLMRDLCVSKALQESFLSILNIQQDNEMENCSASMAIKAESSCKIRRLSLNRNVIPNLKASKRTLVHLRTLMSFRGVEWELKQFQSIFKDYKFLRVLKLEDLDEMRSLPKSVGDLVHLRFLSLKDSVFLGLPRSMGNLVCMEFLDLVMYRFNMVSIPNVLWKMKRLRYLGLPYDFVVKEKFHWGQKKLQLSTLKNLRTLRNFSVNKCDVNDVGKFTKLQRLTFFDEYDLMELDIFPQLVKFKLKHLQSSSFYFRNLSSSWTESELRKMLNYPHSCKLSLRGNIGKLPENKNLPQQLRKLVLLNSQLEEDPMPILEKLKNLIFLMLSSAFMGKGMVCSAGGFPQLKHLLFDYLDDLEEWRAAEGAVPHLSRLGIHRCPKLRAVPSHVSTYDGTQEIYKEIRKCS